MRQRQRGYSLPELLTVVVILGIAAAVAVPDISPSDPHRLDVAVEEFAEAVRYARSESIRTGQPHGIFIDLANQCMKVFRADMTTNPPTPVFDIYHPVSKQLYDVDLTSHRFARADAVTGGVEYQGSCNDVLHTLFDAHGTPWCANPQTVVYRKGFLKLTLGEHSRTLALDGVTGRVTIQ